MKRDDLLARLGALTKEKEEISAKLEVIHEIEPKIEDRIITGLKPVFDEKTKAPLSKINIKQRIAALADELMHDESIHYPVLISVMNGALPFAKELNDRLSERGYRYQYDVLQASSYKGVTSGTLTINNILKIPVGCRDVVVVDDVCDTGKTAKKIMALLFALGAKSVKLMVLVNKDQIREKEVAVDPHFVGFTVSKDAFIAGWGLDYDQLLRNYDESIGAVDEKTLPQGEEKVLFESKEQLNKQLQACMAAMADVTEQLKRFTADARPISPGTSRAAMFSGPVMGGVASAAAAVLPPSDGMGGHDEREERLWEQMKTGTHC